MTKLKLSPTKITPDKQATIVRLSSLSNYSYLHMNDGKTHVFPASLAQYASRLPDFIRIHRRQLINPKCVQAVIKVDAKHAFITLISGEILPVAKRRIEQVTGQLSQEIARRKVEY